MNKTLKNTLLATTGATIIGATAVALNSVPSAIAAIGGAVFGSLCVQSSEGAKAKKREEAIRVASAFKNAYERNKGVVLAEELSFFADIDLETATVFLNALSESQNGQKISIDNTVAFTFPHTQSVLDTLTKNSQAWVESRTQPLLIENQTLKQQLSLIQAQMQMQQTPQQQPVSSWAPSPEPVEQKITSEVDPWKKLL